MKLGIITWFADENYGTCLQAIALSKFLESNNNTPVLLNFDACNYRNTYLISDSNIIRNILFKVFNKINRALFYKALQNRTKKFSELLNEQCSFTKKLNNESEFCDCCNTFDLLIFGSDQIWNPVGYHPIWFGNYDCIKTPKISFAPSLGSGSIPNNLKEFYIQSLAGFSAISLREEKSAKLLNELTGKKTVTVLDPSFLLSTDEWLKLSKDTISSHKTPYVLCYFLKDNINHYFAAIKFALQNKYKLIIIPYRLKSYAFILNSIPGTGPIDFIKLINNAEYVFTDSYHGTVFSIILHKQFYTFERFSTDSYNNQNERIYDILRKFSLSERLVLFNSKKVRPVDDINYALLQPIIEKEIDTSRNFLTESIKKYKKV